MIETIFFPSALVNTLHTHTHYISPNPRGQQNQALIRGCTRERMSYHRTIRMVETLFSLEDDRNLKVERKVIKPIKRER